jgi:hypothetical protein
VQSLVRKPLGRPGFSSLSSPCISLGIASVRLRFTPLEASPSVLVLARFLLLPLLLAPLSSLNLELTRLAPRRAPQRASPSILFCFVFDLSAGTRGCLQEKAKHRRIAVSTHHAVAFATCSSGERAARHACVHYGRRRWCFGVYPQARG